MLKADSTQLHQWRDFTQRVRSAEPAERRVLLHQRARETRLAVLKMIFSAGAGHIGGDFSVTDILTVLYNEVLRIDPGNPDLPARDRFILSKGHCAASLYATLASCGYFPPDELSTFMAPLSALNGHPNRTKVPGVETNTGPLGHGLPVAVGQALASKLSEDGARVFVVMGDGEMQEGSNWEALMSAAHYELSNLSIVIDRNRLQQGARTEDTSSLDPLDAKLEAFGLELRITDGHDFDQLAEALRPSITGRPVGIIANTVKGKGVSFIEDRVEWHHKVPNQEQFNDALKELS